MPLPDELDTLISPILRALRAKLLMDVTGHAVLAYIRGYAQMTQWAGLPYEGPPIQRAIDYARGHCAKLVTGMDDETKTRLADIISKGIENKRGIPGLSRDIRAEFTDMTKHRSDLIATTETNDALEQAFMDRAKELGIEGKEWMTAEDEQVCDICGGAADEGIVPLDHVYEFGSPKPPAHPGCRCALAPARLEK